jgi:hypothetical protein
MAVPPREDEQDPACNPRGCKIFHLLEKAKKNLKRVNAASTIFHPWHGLELSYLSSAVVNIYSGVLHFI